MRKYLVPVLLSFTFLIFLNFHGVSGSHENFSKDPIKYEITIDNYSPGTFVLDFENWKGKNFTPINNNDNNSENFSGVLRRGRIEDQYNFQDNSENFSGVLRRGWIEDQYKFKETKPFTDTHQVVDHYRREPIYEIRTGKTFNSISGVEYDLWWDCSRRTLSSLNNRRSGWWRSYCRYNPRAEIAFGEVESNSFQDLPNDFQYFQGFADWRWYSIRKMGWVFHVQIPYYFKFPYEEGKKEFPVYTEENYTRYKSTTYKITDYTVKNWPTLQAEITLKGKNGYEGNVQLSASSDDDLIDVELENREVHLDSTAKTQLTIFPRKDLRESTHQIALEARGKWNETKKSVHYLDFQTMEKPPVENEIIDQEISDEKPSESGKTDREYRQYVGVSGELRDAETGGLLSHHLVGTKVEVEVNGGPPRTAWWGWNVAYEWSKHTYNHKEWSMELTASARKYNPKHKTAWDSTEHAGTATKDFSLSPRGSH